MYFGREEAFGGSDTGGADYGYITFDNNSTKYGSGGGETSVFRIGTQNDAAGVNSDALALEPVAELYINPGSGVKMGNYSSYWTMSSPGGAGVDGINLAINDTWASMRVIRNNNGSSDGMYIGYGNGNSGLTRIYGGGSTSSAMVRYSTYTQHDGSDRAPIYYDSNDTGYYLDINGANVSNINTIIAGVAYFRSNPGSGVYSGAVSSPPLQVYSNDGGAAFFSFHRAGAYAVNMGLDPDNYLRIGGWSAGVGRWVLDMSGNNWAVGSFRAPIFYDSDNTAYYVDPTGDSRLSGNLNLGSYSNIRFGGTSYAAGVATIEGGYADGFYFYPTGSTNGITFGMVGAYSYASNQFRAPIYYDSANTGYYIDANSDSNLYRLSTYLSPKDNNTNWNTAFQNTPAMSKAYHADISSGGPAGSWWFYESMRHSNASNYWGTQIAWGWEDNANRMFQRNVTNGTFGSWYEYLNTSDRTYNGNLYMTGSIRSTSSDMRAPIFYDQNDTGWYCDPNSTSKFSVVGITTPPTASSYLNIGGYNAYGGGGYNGFLTIYNGWGLATNPYQYWRLNGAGGFEIVNSPYNAVLFTFTQGGDFTAVGNITAYSDRNLKDNFEPITDAITKVMRLQGMTFTRIDKEDPTQRFAGLIAQDVEAVLPEAIQTNETMSYGEIMSVDYNGTIALLVEAIKEQQAYINTLEDKVNSILQKLEGN